MMAASEKNMPRGLQMSQLLHPELLVTDDLKSMLKDRCIQLKNVDFMSREELLAVVHRVAVPLPQRYLAGESPDISNLQWAMQGASMSGGPKEHKTLENCIDFQHKVIKLKESGSDFQNSSKRHAAKRDKISLKRTEQPSSSGNPCPDESPAKKSRAKISWP